MTTEALERAILDSIWSRCQWDFMLSEPQLSKWLEGSTLRATADPDVFNVVLAKRAGLDWLALHFSVIQRSLGAEMNRPVVVIVISNEAVKK